MKRIRIALAALAALAAGGLIAVPASASAATGSLQPLEYTVYNSYWNGGNNAWAESTVAHNWYLSPTNITDISVQTSGSWQEFHDSKNLGQCATLDWANNGSTDKILDETCANKASQLWATHTFGSAQDWYIYNQYLTPSKAGCVGGFQAVIDAPYPNGGLTMRCVETNGDPLPEQIWYFIS